MTGTIRTIITNRWYRKQIFVLDVSTCYGIYYYFFIPEHLHVPFVPDRLTWNAALCCRCCICCLAPTCRSRAPCRLSPHRTPDSGWRKPERQKQKHQNIQKQKGLGHREQTQHTITHTEWARAGGRKHVPKWEKKKKQSQHMIYAAPTHWYKHTGHRDTTIHDCTIPNDLLYWSGKMKDVRLITKVTEEQEKTDFSSALKVKLSLQLQTRSQLTHKLCH